MPASLTLMARLLKSTPPIIAPIGGMMTSLTMEVTILPNAAPMMIPTAMSTTLPFMANSLNSLTIPMTLLLSLDWLLAEQAADGVAGFLGRVRSGLTGECLLNLRAK